MIGFRPVIAFSEQDMPGIEPGPVSWHTSALTNELQKVRMIMDQRCALLDDGQQNTRGRAGNNFRLETPF